MDSAPVVFDISSDEEGWGENKGIPDESRPDGDFDNLDWLSELLEVDVKQSDDSDDVVVVVGETLQKPKQQRAKPKPSIKDMDDDCVILDGDPDKAGAIETDDTNTAVDSDDLVIVGEKGQIACRDYPHSRHLCATYPFASTSHEVHCQQCHCYVCDSLAPCVHWGNGTSSSHHCHATDKDEFWKLQRKGFRLDGKLPVPRLLDPSLTIRPNPSFRVPAAQIQISRSTTIRACSSATNSDILNSSQHPGHVMSRNKYQPHLVSQQLHNISRRDRTHRDASLGPRYDSYRAFKRSGSPMVSLATDRPAYGPSTNSSGTERFRNPPPVVSSHVYQNAYQQVSSFRTSVPSNLRATSRLNTGPSVVGSGASHPPMPTAVNSGTGFVGAAQPNMSTDFGSSTPSQSQPNMGSNLGNPVSSELQVSSSRPKMRINLYTSSVPSESQVSCSLPNLGDNILSSVSSQSQVSSQPNMGTNFVSPMSSVALQPNDYVHPVPYQPQMDSEQNIGGSSFVDTTPAAAVNYDHPQAVYYVHPQNAMESRFSESDAGWNPFVDPNQEPFMENQSSGESYHPPFVADFELQTPPAGRNPNFQYDNWIVENQSASGGGGAFDVTSASGLNMYSPELDPISMGGNFLF